PILKNQLLDLVGPQFLDPCVEFVEVIKRDEQRIARERVLTFGFLFRTRASREQLTENSLYEWTEFRLLLGGFCFFFIDTRNESAQILLVEQLTPVQPLFHLNKSRARKLLADLPQKLFHTL